MGYIPLKEKGVFLSRKPKASHLNVYRFCYHAQIPATLSIVKRLCESTKIFKVVFEGFCSGFCPFLNGDRQWSQYFRPQPVLNLMLGVNVLRSLTRPATVSSLNALTGNDYLTWTWSVYCSQVRLKNGAPGQTRTD